MATANNDGVDIHYEVTGDFVLTEGQVTRSAEHVAATWRYERLEVPGHWMQLEAPER